MRTIDQYFDEFTSVNGSNIGYPVMYDYPENEPDPILDSYIQFEDPEAERVMVNAFGKNGKITYRQARNVTDNTWIQTFGISITGAKNWKSIPTNTLLKNISKFNESAISLTVVYVYISPPYSFKECKSPQPL